MNENRQRFVNDLDTSSQTMRQHVQTDLETQNQTLRNQTRLHILKKKDRRLIAQVNSDAITSSTKTKIVIKIKSIRSKKMRLYKDQSVDEHLR